MEHVENELFSKSSLCEAGKFLFKRGQGEKGTDMEDRKLVAGFMEEKPDGRKTTSMPSAI